MKNKIDIEISYGGNAYLIMGQFVKGAEESGWTKEEIKGVLDVCESGNYDELQETITEACKGETQFKVGDRVCFKISKTDEPTSYSFGFVIETNNQSSTIKFVNETVNLPNRFLSKVNEND